MDNLFYQAVLLSNRCDLEALICQREGMIAENLQRQHRGEAMAYTEKEFNEIADQMRCIVSDVHRFS